VWRIDFDAGGAAVWRMYKLAATADAVAARNFLQPPDVVATKRYTGVLVGSGDREKPLKATGVDRFNMVKDKAMPTVAADPQRTVATWPIDLDGTLGGSMIDVSVLLADDVRAAIAADANNGWFRTLGPAEKVVNAPLTAAGVVYFGTNQPSAASGGRCLARLGTARAYAVAFSTGTPVHDNDGDGAIDADDAAVALTGGGMPPPVIGGLATVRDDATGRDALVPFVIGTGGSSGGSGGSASPGAPARLEQKLPRSLRKTYWYQRSLP
jgi:type IV pilus assembly protein PilY1